MRNNTGLISLAAALLLLPAAGFSALPQEEYSKAAGVGLYKLSDSSDPQGQYTAIRQAAAHKDKAAIRPLLSNIDAYLAAAAAKGPYEENLKERLRAIDSIWALGEIGSPAVMGKLQRYYAESDDVIKINLVLAVGKLQGAERAAGWLQGVAGNYAAAAVVRTAAYEVLAALGQPAPAAAAAAYIGMEPGDIVFTGGIVGTISGWFSPDMPVGHVGIFTGVELRGGRLSVALSEAATDLDTPAGVRNVNSWAKLTTGYKFPLYGNRTSRQRPTDSQRAAIVSEARRLGTLGLKYDGNHFNQKGPAEFDCVGLAEYLYESVGLNPTPDSYETGLGWPLSPYEQFEATVNNSGAPWRDLSLSPFADAAERLPGPALRSLQLQPFRSFR